MTWISLPSFSVTSALTGILAQLGSASSASSKSDGRTPRITSWSKNRSRPGLASMTAAEPEPVPGEDQGPVSRSTWA
jgi:hypothetical protein